MGSCFSFLSTSNVTEADFNQQNDDESGNCEVISVKPAHFLVSYNPHQKFLLPNSIIYYMAKKVSAALAYQKLILTCKYFFIKNPFIIIETFKFCYYRKEYWTYFMNTEYIINLNNCGLNKFVITQEVFHSSYNTPNLLSSIMPKLHQVNASKVRFQYVDIPFNDFLFLASNAEEFDLFCAVVKYPDGSVVPLEKLVAVLPKLKSVELYDEFLTCISTETVKELLKAPNFKRIDNISFLGLPDTFDIYTFFIFIKKNKHVKISLSFCHEISDAYRNCIDKIFDEIIAENNHEYLMPYIDCQRLDYMKNHILREKYYADNRLSKNIDFV